MVECKSSKNPKRTLPTSEVTDFCARFSLARSSGSADLGWLITNQSVPDSAWTTIREARLSGSCELFTFETLLNRIIDFTQYASNVRLMLSSVASEYVEPRTVPLERSEGREPRFGTFLAEWLSNASSSVAFLLADYGQGKTTCCLRILGNWLDDRNYLSGRVPLYIRLRDVANQGYKLPAMLRVSLHEGLGLTYPSFEFLRYMANKGRLLFIFDGLDEVSFSAFWSEVGMALREITALATPPTSFC